MSTTSAADLSINGNLSWGFFPLQCSRKMESTSLRPKSVRRPGGLPRDPRMVPNHPLRCHSQVFSTSQRRLFLPQPACHFQTGHTPGVFLSGIHSSHTAPATRRHRRLPPSRSSCESGLSPPRREPSQARETINLGCSPLPPLAAFGAFVRVGIDPHRQAMFSVPAADLPLLGFHLPMV